MFEYCYVTKSSFSDEMFTVGDQVIAFWAINRGSYGSWYPATIIKVNPRSYHISYDGWGAEWNETVQKRYVRRRRRIVTSEDAHSSDSSSCESNVENRVRDTSPAVSNEESAADSDTEQNQDETDEDDQPLRPSTANEHQGENEILGKDGTKWWKFNDAAPSTPGRSVAHNVFIGKPGLPAFVRDKAVTPLKSWFLFVGSQILDRIRLCTEEESKRKDVNINLDHRKLLKYLSLVYMRGVYGHKHSVEFLWSAKYGPNVFRKKCREKHSMISKDVYGSIPNQLVLPGSKPINLL